MEPEKLDTERPRRIAVRRYFLVYQGGMANLFRVRAFNLRPYGRDEVRVAQGSFDQCRRLAFGLGLGGHTVRTAWCNKAGDIANEAWTDDRFSQPFADDTLPVTMERGKEL